MVLVSAISWAYGYAHSTFKQMDITYELASCVQIDSSSRDKLRH